MIDTQSNELLNKLLNGDVESLSNQEKLILWENRAEIIQHLNTIFSNEIPRLLENKQCLNATAVFWAFRLAGFLNASEAFPWLQKLCHLPIEVFEQSLGDYFVTEELAYLLADTMGKWTALKIEIENPDLNEYIRNACLEALVFSAAKGHIDRIEITEYFKSLFHRILSGELDDVQFSTFLVSSCTDFWPGECLEEIRETFGLNLVDEFFIDINCVLERFSQGKDHCLEIIQKQLRQHNFWETQTEPFDLHDEENVRNLNRIFELADQASDEADPTLKGINKGSQRNEICSCGSGRKFKKCCLYKPFQKTPSDVTIEESVISYGPLEESGAMKALPEDAKKSILDLSPLLQENPQEVLKKTPEFISKYPDIPMLYNFLYGAYRKTGHPREAMQLMKETLRIFPDYLFARVEYALYLLRRGEPEQAYAALKNAGTLSQLYPERKIFHAAEWKAFSYTQSLYFIQKGDINQAKIYLSIIQKIAPKSNEITDLQKKIKSKLFSQFLERQRKGPN